MLTALIRLDVLTGVTRATMVSMFCAVETRKMKMISGVDVFGAARVMWGTDYPFVMLEEDNAYVKSVERVRAWDCLTQQEEDSIMRGTVESLLGKWG